MENNGINVMEECDNACLTCQRTLCVEQAYEEAEYYNECVRNGGG